MRFLILKLVKNLYLKGGLNEHDNMYIYFKTHESEMEKFDKGREHKKCTEKCARMHNFLCMLLAYCTLIGLMAIPGKEGELPTHITDAG